jgi:hypothetical protein
MTRTWVNLATARLVGAPLALPAAEGNPVTPNLLVILADDPGHGDVLCYNPQRGKIPTAK